MIRIWDRSVWVPTDLTDMGLASEEYEMPGFGVRDQTIFRVSEKVRLFCCFTVCTSFSNFQAEQEREYEGCDSLQFTHKGALVHFSASWPTSEQRAQVTDPRHENLEWPNR